MRSALAEREAVLPPGAMEWVYSKDAARGTVMALDAKDLGPRVFNITMGSLTTPNEMASRCRPRLQAPRLSSINQQVLGLALQSRQPADLSCAKRYLGYEPRFRLQDAFNDLADWMRRYLA